jgi:metal-responsive CopG/Arc/MetJ family transcriptional regulator
MTHVKTAVSIEESLFREAESLAENMKVSRSKLFAAAISEFISKYKNQQLLSEINAAYDDAPDKQEKNKLEAMRGKQRQLLLDEPW